VIPEAAITKVATSIAAFGFRNPMLIMTDGTLIAGHTRLLAAQRLGLEAVPVIVCADLDDARAKALRLADNRTAQETSWDYELLGIELADLSKLGLDLELTGFGQDELAQFLAAPTPGLTDPDEVPPPPPEPVTRAGDLWLLGEHRLLCADATSQADVRRLMAGKRAGLMCTDPPYFVNYDGTNRPQKWGKTGGPPAAESWDRNPGEAEVRAFYQAFLSAAREEALGDAPALYQWFGMMRIETVLAAWRKAGLLPHQVLIWHKSQPVLGRSHYAWNFEPCLYGWVKGNVPKAKPPAGAAAVWEIPSRRDDPGIEHLTVKPVEVVRRPLSYHTRPGGLLYEPFAGSGTALIAAEMTGRRCYALEISPQFCDLIVRRWANFTGRSALLEPALCPHRNPGKG
jgi:DNA modification methylase